MGSVALSLVLLLVIAVFPDYVAGVSERFTAVDPLDNDRVRTTAFSLLVWEQRPVWGSGYNAHTFAFEKAGLLPGEGREFWATPTSTPVQILADSGVVGFGFFLLFALLAIVLAFRAIRAERDSRERAALAGLGSWIVAFLLLNHSAAWLLPGSGLSAIVFATAGIVSGAVGRQPPPAPG
jgi:O-antigen ligase